MTLKNKHIHALYIFFVRISFYFIFTTFPEYCGECFQKIPTRSYIKSNLHGGALPKFRLSLAPTLKALVSVKPHPRALS
jgi:hypothetical protein